MFLRDVIMHLISKKEGKAVLKVTGNSLHYLIIPTLFVYYSVELYIIQLLRGVSRFSPLTLTFNRRAAESVKRENLDTYNTIR